jgi:hypothetical protein
MRFVEELPRSTDCLSSTPALVQAVFGAARCLIRRQQLQAAKALLRKWQCDVLNVQWEFHYLQALIACKRRQYEAAKTHNSYALQCGKNTHAAVAAKAQRRFLESHESRRQNRDVPESVHFRFTEMQLTKFPVLSIDGGGMRGIMPAIFLQEFERVSKRRVMDVLRVAAGTSTG